MTQPCRLAAGGVIDRSRTLAFDFDGARHDGHPGDTLASALLANGIHFVARSFKYHRPRGIYGCGCDEPNALVQLARGARTEPNVRATMQPLYDGLVAQSQNRWPSLAFDVGAINDALAPMLPAGFYYKTFMWPRSPRWWLRYEHVIRNAAGMGRAADAPDPDRYEHRYAHCDVLVVGAGAAGLAAANASARAGARVILCDENATLGHTLASEARSIDGIAAGDWVRAVVDELSSHVDVDLLARTTAFGCYDDNLVTLCERVADDRADPLPYAAAAAHLEGSRENRRHRDRRARAPDRLRRQRPSRHAARRCRARLRRTLRGTPGFARGRVHQQRLGVCDARSRCRTPASRSRRSSMPAAKASAPAS